MKTRMITLCVNGKNHRLEVPVNRTLLQALRDDLQLTETKYGCGTGECGGCTVLVDGKDSICSCLTLAVEAEGRHIITVGGMTREGELHPIQQAFIDEGAIQCGYCTPGMIMKTASILANNPTAIRGRNPTGAGRQYLPVHGVRKDRACGPTRQPDDE